MEMIYTCVSQHRIIPLELYEADEYETDNNDDNDTSNSANKSKKNIARKIIIKRFTELFVKPYPYEVEEEPLPQTVQICELSTSQRYKTSNIRNIVIKNVKIGTSTENNPQQNTSHKKMHSQGEIQKEREYTLNELSEICDDWVRHSTVQKVIIIIIIIFFFFKKKKSDGNIDYTLMAHTVGEFIAVEMIFDVVCVGPNFLTFGHFFDKLDQITHKGMKRREEGYNLLFQVQKKKNNNNLYGLVCMYVCVYVPVTSFEYNGVYIPWIDKNWDILDDYTTWNM
ncbi:hypothetical protein RFI_03904 [Reticulomyxa filosa]|uniref:Uncharacterized protein n=1 Tax=Reticulomyxa filosa TaxID=46433 RepID=X6P505_RETFI|nr:hypothetical protein RFI_03904 [Reticulomyxa filosa]|eukprot:ETO33203.1 hypothetical protein RFI_03904 [Reticulomyxa filosa]